MKVQLSFTVDLADLIEQNKDSILLEDRSQEEIIEELEELFEGDIEEGLTRVLKDYLECEFEELFNY